MRVITSRELNVRGSRIAKQFWGMPLDRLDRARAQIITFDWTWNCDRKALPLPSARDNGFYPRLNFSIAESEAAVHSGPLTKFTNSADRFIRRNNLPNQQESQIEAHG